MRIDLEIIKKIEAYLTGSMQAAEVIEFEKLIASDTELRNAVEQQKNLMKAMKKMNIRNIASNAGRRYSRIRLIRNSIIFVIIAIFILVAGLSIKYYLDKPTSNQTKIENVAEDSNIAVSSDPKVSEVQITDSVGTRRNSVIMHPLFREITLRKGDTLALDSSRYVVSVLDTSKTITTQIQPAILNPRQYKFPDDKESQYFIVSPQKDFTIKGKKGTIVKFYGNSFVDSKGSLINQDIQLELIEVYSRWDMVRYGIQTMADKELLESAGMIYIHATLGDSVIFLAQNEFYQIEFPIPVLDTRSKEDDMGVFYGDSITGPQNWTQALRNFFSDRTYVDNMQQLDKYIFNSKQLNWINCDRFIGQNNRTNLVVNLNDTNQVNVCLIFNNINSVMNISDKKNGFIFNFVPIGETATIVAFKKEGEDFFFAKETVDIHLYHKADLILEKITKTQFENRVKEFN